MSPTGYTSALYDGKEQTFEEFVMECARAFGALVLLRDDPAAEIPDAFAPSPYHQDILLTAVERLQTLQTWSDEESEEQAERDYDARVTAYEDARERANAVRARYESMLIHVLAWNPPTDEHQGLKDFMQEQLEGSIKFDTDLAFLTEPKRTDGQEYRAQEIERAVSSIAYHGEEIEKEHRRARERTRWVRQLRESLTGPEVAPSAGLKTGPGH